MIVRTSYQVPSQHDPDGGEEGNTTHVLAFLVRGGPASSRDNFSPEGDRVPQGAGEPSREVVVDVP